MVRSHIKISKITSVNTVLGSLLVIYLDYKSCHSSINQCIKNMFVRGLGVPDITGLEEISFF